MRAHRPHHLSDNNWWRLNGHRIPRRKRSSNSEIAVRGPIKERIIARQLWEALCLREYRRGERRRQDQGCAEKFEASHLSSPASGRD
jgi:hypothetical protein